MVVSRVGPDRCTPRQYPSDRCIATDASDLMYSWPVNSIELFLLGRTLMKIGEEAIPTEGISANPALHRSILIVASDIRAHPGTTVSEITGRTGFPQSQV